MKSMFSPSPEHDAFDRSKLAMITANAKRNESPKSEKLERQSSTPSKREKRGETSTTPTSHKTSQQDRKQITKPDNTNVPPLIPDSKKRPFATVDDGEFSRDSKARKVDPIKTEPTAHLTGAMMKQPIETNPDIVKSLLQECYTTSKFDSFGMDSPLDVTGTDPSHTQPLIESLKTELDDSLMPKLEARDNGYEDEHLKKSKSKKKKDKHQHKHKKKKSHKSDREDRKDPSLKIILSKDKSESKSSPESVHTPGGLKIKIPIKDVNKTDLVPSLPPAPLKLKISKEKIGSFNSSGQAISDGGSTSSSSHKKKDKDRSKSKSSKHGSNNNNNSDFKDTGYQHQQMPVSKVSDSIKQNSFL